MVFRNDLKIKRKSIHKHVVFSKTLLFEVFDPEGLLVPNAKYHQSVGSLFGGAPHTDHASTISKWFVKTIHVGRQVQVHLFELCLSQVYLQTDQALHLWSFGD